MTTNKCYLFMMLGYPGSGKSFVAGWLAPHMHAVHLRSDDMRLKMFSDEERLEFHKDWRYQQLIHGGMQYAAHQVLAAGYPVIYDSNHNTRRSRSTMQRVASELGAVPILIWVKAPLELARQRVLEREANGGIKVFDVDFVERMAQKLQVPETNELVIELDGQQGMKQQRESFDKQLAVILSGKVQ